MWVWCIFPMKSKENTILTHHLFYMVGWMTDKSILEFSQKSEKTIIKRVYGVYGPTDNLLQINQDHLLIRP